MGKMGWLGLGLALLQSVMAQATPGYDIIVIAGQSNAAGWGRADGTGSYVYLDDTDYSSYGNRVFQLSRTLLSSDSNNKKVIPATHTLQSWGMSGNEPFIGFGFTFARRYAGTSLAADRNVLIIPAALAGRSILFWNGENKIDLPSTLLPNGSYLNSEEKSYNAYEDMQERISYALSLKSDGTGPMTGANQGENRIVAVLWGHGENNIYGVAFNDQNDYSGTHSSVADERVYYFRLKELFSRLRSDFSTQNFSILLNEVPPAWEVPYNNASGLPAYMNTNGLNAKRKITYVQQKIEARLPMVGFVSSADLLSDPDYNGIHFSAQSQIYLGEWYFAKYQQMQQQAVPAANSYLHDKLSPYLPTQAQLDYYLNLVANGQSCGVAYQLLLYSNQDFANALNAGNEDQFVKLAFNFLLDRDPEAQEISDWKQILVAYSHNRIKTFLSMLAMPELLTVCGAKNAE